MADDDNTEGTSAPEKPVAAAVGNKTGKTAKKATKKKAAPKKKTAAKKSVAKKKATPKKKTASSSSKKAEPPSQATTVVAEVEHSGPGSLDTATPPDDLGSAQKRIAVAAAAAVAATSTPDAKASSGSTRGDTGTPAQTSADFKAFESAPNTGTSSQSAANSQAGATPTPSPSHQSTGTSTMTQPASTPTSAALAVAASKSDSARFRIQAILWVIVMALLIYVVSLFGDDHEPTEETPSTKAPQSALETQEPDSARKDAAEPVLGKDEVAQFSSSQSTSNRQSTSAPAGSEDTASKDRGTESVKVKAVEDKQVAKSNSGAGASAATEPAAEEPRQPGPASSKPSEPASAPAPENEPKVTASPMAEPNASPAKTAEVPKMPERAPTARGNAVAAPPSPAEMAAAQETYTPGNTQGNAQGPHAEPPQSEPQAEPPQSEPTAPDSSEHPVPAKEPNAQQPKAEPGNKAAATLSTADGGTKQAPEDDTAGAAKGSDAGENAARDRQAMPQKSSSKSVTAAAKTPAESEMPESNTGDRQSPDLDSLGSILAPHGWHAKKLENGKVEIAVSSEQSDAGATAIDAAALGAVLAPFGWRLEQDAEGKVVLESATASYAVPRPLMPMQIPMAGARQLGYVMPPVPRGFNQSGRAPLYGPMGIRPGGVRPGMQLRMPYAQPRVAPQGWGPWAWAPGAPGGYYGTRPYYHPYAAQKSRGYRNQGYGNSYQPPPPPP